MAKKKTSGRIPRSGNVQAASRPASAGGTKGADASTTPKSLSKDTPKATPKGRSQAASRTAAGTATKSTAGGKPTGKATAKPPGKPTAGAQQSTATPKTAPAKPARTGLTRAERLAAAAKARRRRKVQVRAAVAGGVAVILLVVGFLVVSNNRDRAREAAGFETGSCDFDRKSDGDAGAGRNHVANPTYKVDPPAGGDHNTTAAPAGTYTFENKPPDGQLVHSLEHGYVIIWYRPDLPPTDLTALQEFTQRHARDVLLVPRPSLVPLVAATAWHARVLCGATDVATLERFVDRYVNQGPEKITH